jgi:hypothetical protein
VQIDAVERYTTYLPALTVVPVDVVKGATALRLSHPDADDGTDVSTCRGGTCSVRVDWPVSIPLDPATGVRGDLRVREISADSATVSLHAGGQPEGHHRLRTDQHRRLRNHIHQGLLRPTLVPGAELRLPELTIRLSALNDGAAVLQLIRR